MRNPAPLIVIGCHKDLMLAVREMKASEIRAFAGVTLCHFTADARKYVP
jgi:hypothetical protein